MTAVITNKDPKKSPIAILISGRGSNMRSLITACESLEYPAQVRLVLSNRPEAQGLIYARSKGIEAQAIPHKNYASREDFEAALHKAIRESGVELICLAGFMRVLTSSFVEKWQGRMLNIHPSLLPKYPGLDTHKRAIAAKDREHGCTVHLVEPEVDSGPILGQAKVLIEPNDDEESLAAKVLEREHRLYPEVLKKYIEANRHS